MSLVFSAAELDDMQMVQEGHMMDTCRIAEPAVVEDSYNNPTESWNWTTAVESACGFNGNPGRELLNQVPDSQAVVRIPIETTLTQRARIRVTKRFGRTITPPITFAVIGQPRQGPSGLLVWLTKITDGTDG